MKTLKLCPAVRVFSIKESICLCCEIIQKQRLDYLHNVLFGGVVRAVMTPVLFIHDGLEQRTENGR